MQLTLKSEGLRFKSEQGLRIFSLFAPLRCIFDFFPLRFLSFLLADFQRRERVLEDLAQFKGALLILFFCHRDWLHSAGNISQCSKQVLFFLERISMMDTFNTGKIYLSNNLISGQLKLQLFFISVIDSRGMIHCNHCIPRVVSWLLRKWRKFNKTLRERFSALINNVLL